MNPFCHINSGKGISGLGFDWVPSISNYENPSNQQLNYKSLASFEFAQLLLSK